MDDSLTISGGGTTTVATDELFSDAAKLGAAAGVIADWTQRASRIATGLDGLDLDASTGLWAEPRPVAAMQRAEAALRRCGDEIEDVRAALIASAERYGWAERTLDGFWSVGGGLLATLLGARLPMMLPLGGALLLGGAANAVASKLFGSTPLNDWLAEHKGLLSDPVFVRVVRIAADSADEFAAGALHVPWLTSLGGSIGAPEGAAVLLAVAGLIGTKVLVDGPVTVSRGSHADAPAGHPAAAPLRAATPPTGVGDLADRVPGAGDAQIRIEHYGEAGDNRWIVYIGGTVEFGLTAGEQPFDNTSNVHGIADDAWIDELRAAGAESGAGERAVRQAMAEAGVKPGDPLLAVGYSAGGIIAAKLAADPELNTVAAVNLGGPVASAETRESVPVLSIEHEEDFVPAVGGAGHPSPERLTVSRSVLEEGRTYEAMVPAHELFRYRATAALVDESEEERLAAFRTFVGEFAGGGQGAASEWIARRELSPSKTGAR